MRGLDRETAAFLRAVVGDERIFLREPMRRHTTFRAGGEAACLAHVTSAAQLARLLPFFADGGQRYFVVGNGSNLLVSDRGFDGVVLCMADAAARIRVEGECLYADAGASDQAVAAAARDHGLSGLEFLSGIPGTLGGALVMNAGAYGGEMKDVVQSVTVVDTEGRTKTLSCGEMRFGYRTSAVKHSALVITSAVLRLRQSETKRIASRMEELARMRREKQPLEHASAGSTFQRPEGYFAGKLIMEAGLRGLRIGDAQVSEKHCGFIINRGGASAGEIYRLIVTVQERVKAHSGVDLTPEVILLGEFG